MDDHRSTIYDAINSDHSLFVFNFLPGFFNIEKFTANTRIFRSGLLNYFLGIELEFLA